MLAEVGVEVEAEAGSRRSTGCNGRSKRGSGERRDIAVGHSLVGEDQTYRVYQSQTSVVVVGVVDVVLVVEDVNERKKKS